MSIEIISEDIPKCQHVLPFAFIIWRSYNQWRNQKFEPGWKLSLKGPTGQHSEKNMRNDGESGRRWLY